MNQAPLVSVIIPNLNSNIIDRTLTAIRNQDFDLTQAEVLVIGLDEPRLVQSDRLVKFVSSGKPATPAQNRNIGLRVAQGNILCFTDSDCIPMTDWLTSLMTVYSNNREIFAVGGGVIFNDNNYWILCDHFSWFHRALVDAPPGWRSDLPTLNFSVRREVVDKVGLFNEDYVTGEDVEWTTRMRLYGYDLYFEPQAVVTHCPTRNSFRMFWQHAYEFGRNSPKIRSTQTNHPSFRAALIPQRWWLLLILTPVWATLATIRICIAYRHPRKIWLAIPGIWLSKVAWCLGGVSAMFHATHRQSTDSTSL